MPARPRVIVVVGATGTGKSELAVSLATRYNGEIINADAMQLYRGLEIITNKIPEAERRDIPHHLLGCIGLDEVPWTVGKFVSKAISTIDEIRARGKTPIIVGGTHYYVQSLLFKDTLADQDHAGEGGGEDTTGPLVHGQDKDANPQGIKPEHDLLQDPTATLLEKLREVDPVMAARWHPNDRRKIQRSLQIWLQTGRRASDLYAEQKMHGTFDNKENTALKDGKVIPRPTTLRYQTLLFWTHAQPDALKARLDNRVESMLSRGMIEEVQQLVTYRDRNQRVHDMKSGIWVSIGFKEFLPYIEHRVRAARPPSPHLEPAGEPTVSAQDCESDLVFRLCLSETQARTRQYAKSQVRWIRIKLINALRAAREGTNGLMYVLDSTRLERYGENVERQAWRLTGAWLADEGMPDPETLHPLASELLQPKRAGMGPGGAPWETQRCEACGVVGTTPSDWWQHVNSGRHKKRVASANLEQTRDV